MRAESYLRRIQGGVPDRGAEFVIITWKVGREIADYESKREDDAERREEAGVGVEGAAQSGRSVKIRQGPGGTVPVSLRSMIGSSLVSFRFLDIAIVFEAGCVREFKELCHEI